MKRLGIHYKITFIFVLALGIILLGIYLYLNSTLGNHTFRRIETTLTKETSLAAYIFTNYAKDSPLSYEVDKIANDVGGRLGLRVTVIGLNGTVFGDSELNETEMRRVENHLYRPEVQEALKSGIGKSRRFSTTVKKDMLYVAMPSGDKKTEGLIRLAIPLEEIETISAKLKKTLLLCLFVAFIFAIAISYILTVLISKPIKEISLSARDMASGNISKRIRDISNDEIGDLAKAFNYMSEQIKIRISQLTESKTRLEAIFSSMFDGIIVVNSKGDIVLINDTLRNLLQVKGNPTGKKPLEVIRNIEIQEIADDTLSSNKGVTAREIQLLMPEERTLLVHATPVTRGDGPDGAVLVFHDITELRKLEKMRKDFVANVSHELRTPVSNIKGYAETLLDGALKDEKNAEEFVKIIYSDSERLSNLINDLLDLSKIESGKLPMAKKPCSIRAIAKTVIAQLRKQAEDKSVSVTIDIPNNINNVLSDEKRILQALFNLIDNAIKYTPGGGSVKVRAREEGKFVRTEVIDSGIGISEKDLPRIFERFYRVDKGRSRELGGTGLGLSIVKHIAQSHAGDVSVKSTLGQGSTFIFTIPKAS